MYAIKFRERGGTAWWFATPRGHANRLRIHAAKFNTKEEAQAVVDSDQANNPELEFKVVPLFKKKATA